MKRIKEYKTLFSVEGEATLKELKTTYRNLVKEWHPDKFQADDNKALEAETMSRRITDGYHFLVSINSETKAKNLEAFTNTTTQCTIADYKHKGLLLEITFTDGSTYEYFGVNKGLFIKFNNSDKQMRFAKRSIFSAFPYRQSKKASPDLV